MMEGRSSLGYHGINRFNAKQSDRKRDIPLAEVMNVLSDTHKKFMAFIEEVPESHFIRETPFRQRLRYDTYSHYREHAKSITNWRQARAL